VSASSSAVTIRRTSCADGEPAEVRQVGCGGIGDQHLQPQVVGVDPSTDLSSGPPTQVGDVEADR
jgi:hypothetical protein